MFISIIFPFIDKLNKADKFRTETDVKLISASVTTRKFIKNNPNILFSRADKGTVVALDRKDYLSKMEKCLSDINTDINLLYFTKESR